MFSFVIRRFVHLIPTFLGATLLAFMISQLVPGDFFNTMALNPDVRPETIEKMREKFGLNDPAHVQYFKWMSGILQGDFGLSFSTNGPVVELIRDPIKNSMIIVIASIVLLWAIAIPLGVYSAVRQYSLGDQIVSMLSYVGLAIPNFFFALLLILLVFYLRSFTSSAFDYTQTLLPVAKMTSNYYDELSQWGKFWNVVWHAILPSIILATSGVAGFTRILRAQMLEFLNSDFIRTAKAKGLSDRTITYKHALRPAIIPFVASIGAILPGLIGGAGLIEIVFAWPGITPRLLTSIYQQDIYVVLGFLIISTFLLIIGNLVSDLLLALVDPRIRYS